ncbi:MULTISPECIES: TetR/AcrR family transcriptional regulator [Streptomyces]|uniref:TetR family transcriptional regulator n=2 Tax=Streptomyces virginiae TaxID=1961 RepID=A0ABQ3NWC2_STRVG|nr:MULTISPECIES: TetR/AcrR family transcriptional regulator [Streptomyces]MBP2344558.1 AcrR family transcriptional regulator [Streptomyces virginiae]MCI4081951.1 TetR/AcrR family transcriptional regulator [Streptomyces sp. MMS21 TC-5]MEC4571738.1 TetR/AcrR family transcriptional regulator [Streptomyces sp. CMAA1738]GGP97115.1 TetR family transcriptional regulator [Streptomyces virginiae]GHI17086.1 TetR family transcriptional regulator [Streptomyces virginiae]
MTEAMAARRSRITPERQAELHEAVLDLLRDVGYEALTMDAVAARTKSSKATLYRQWGSKPELVAKALRCTQPVSLREIDTGSLRGDFALMVEHSDDAQMAKDTALMRGLAHAVHESPELHKALRDLLVDPEITGLQVMLQRAVDRGEITPGCPALDFVPHMLIGAFIALPLIEDRPVDRAFLGDFIDAVVFPALGV